MKKALFLYDDRVTVTNEINAIVNARSYGNIYYKSTTFAKNIQKNIAQIDNIDFIKINKTEDIEKLESHFYTEQIIHFTANINIVNLDNFIILIKKIKYVQDNVYLCLNDKKNIIELFSDDSPKSFFNKIKDMDFSTPFQSEHKTIEIDNVDTLISLSHTTNFLYFFTGSFETRFFNSVQGDRYQLVKSSTDIDKIESEYSFYYHLPETFRFWFVQPFNFQKNSESASYEMERYNIPNMALQWIHNSFEPHQFERFLNKYLTFIKQKPQIKVTKEIYIQHLQKNYLSKVQQRIDDFKKQDKFNKINMLISNLTHFNGIDEIINEYYLYYQKSEKELLKNNEYLLTITHGDTCFSNILYDKRSELFKLIDPKGSRSQEGIYTDAYYDIAKVSHSILGNYDYINNEIYDTYIDKNLMANLSLNVRFNDENKQLFVDGLLLSGFSPSIIRTFECSLFLSMLPLHMDRINNVFSFILIAINILSELKNNEEI